MSTEVGVGILGIGFMGRAHFAAYQQVAGARVTAIATRDRSKWTGDWRNISGNFGADGTMVDLSQVSKYEGLDGLLSDPSVTLVDICLPTALHRDAAIAAMEAGRDVLVEKPIALTSEEAEDMLAVAESTGRRLLVAHVLHFMPAYGRLRQALTQDGTSILGLTMTRQVSTPWQEPHWKSRLDATGGPVLDLLIHDADLIQSALGSPQRVLALGTEAHGYVVDYHVTVDYGRGRGPVTLMGGICGVPGKKLEQNFRLRTLEGSMEFDPNLRGPALTITRPEQPETLEELPEVNPIVDELQYAVDAVRSTNDAELLSASRATESLRLCEAIDRSARGRDIVTLSP